MTDVVIPLRLVVDEAAARKHYDEYASDCAYYLERGELTPDHPDVGYRTGTPAAFADYLAGWVEGVLGDVVGEHYSYRIERAEVDATR